MDLVVLAAALVGIAAGLFALIKDWLAVKQRLLMFVRWLGRTGQPNVSRRKAVIGTFSVIAIIGVYLTAPAVKVSFRNLVGTRHPLANPRFVKNGLNGVVHDTEVCKKHLPKRQLAAYPEELPPSSLFHKSKHVHVASLERAELDLEAVVLNAIRISPTSTHLYKRVVKKWGREKEYEKIHELLDSSIDYLSSLLARSGGDRKRIRKYEKAIRELKQRRDSARFLSTLKAI